jgi:hypothetical protein
MLEVLPKYITIFTTNCRKTGETPHKAEEQTLSKTGYPVCKMVVKPVFFGS